MRSQHPVVFVTSNDFKVDENEIMKGVLLPNGGEAIADVIEFSVRRMSIPESLEVDIAKLVYAEALYAYQRVRVPCMVEHAGLVLDGHDQYPGGLTKAIWDALGDRFLEETGWAGRPVIARAVVGYCDGQRIHTFVGETKGRVASAPSGNREFYWDTVFVPDGGPENQTYADLAANGGLEHKVRDLSQSTKAVVNLAVWLQGKPRSPFWPVA